jgi:GNAT superfamily N-acetyltransferase
MEPSDAGEVSALVRQVFDRQIAPLYAPEGAAEIRGYVHADRLLQRSVRNHWVLVAVDGTRIVAAAEVRDEDHLSLLFVDEGHQRHGIGRRLIAEALRRCKERNPGLTALTVHASPNSVVAYQAMGFRATGPMRTVNGVIFRPMELVVGFEGAESDARIRRGDVGKSEDRREENGRT